MARSDRGPGLQAPGRPQRDDQRSSNSSKVAKLSEKGVTYVDYKDSEQLRRLMSGNGKMNGRKRNGASAMQQRMIARAIKRARFMALLPFVDSAV